jgi:hypothetical protein
LSPSKPAGGTIVRRGELDAGEPYVFLDPGGYEVEVWFERPTPFDPAENRAKGSSAQDHRTP